MVAATCLLTLPFSSFQRRTTPVRCKPAANRWLRRRDFLPVRLIVGILLLLFGFGTLSCRVEGLAARRPERPATSQWVRTADGWERTDRWHIQPAARATLHPIVVAAGQGLVSVLALVALGATAGCGGAGATECCGRARPD
jgi:hypothetical protein